MYYKIINHYLPKYTYIYIPQIRIWDVNVISDLSTINSAASPHLVAYKSMGVGKLFSLNFSPDDPFVLAAGGDKG